MDDSSAMSDPNLGELASDVAGSVTPKGQVDSGLVGVISDFVRSGWSPLAEFPRASDDGGVHRIVEGRTFVRETILPGSVTEPFTGPDTSIGQVAPHGTQPDGPMALKVALQMKAVRAFIIGLVAVGTFFQLSNGIG